MAQKDRKSGLTLFNSTWLRYSWILPGYTNKCEMRIFAPRRSGHHAIINWIRYQFKSRYCFLNNCRVYDNPLETCRRADSIIASRYVVHNQLSWDREVSGKLSKKGFLLYNFEQQPLPQKTDIDLEAQREKWLGKSKKNITFLS
jgi:hypothetical protein